MYIKDYIDGFRKLFREVSSLIFKHIKNLFK